MYELDFLPVGDSNGDAICIRYGDYHHGYTFHVIDGGYTQTGHDIIKHIATYYGNPTFIDHVTLSHADDDHATGLIPVLENFEVGTLWMNRPWLYAAEVIGSFHGNYTVAGLAREIRSSYPRLAELEDIANKKRIQIRDVFAGQQIGSFRVLAPTRERYLELIPEFSRTPDSYAETSKTLTGILADLVKELKHYVENWTTETLSENPPACTASNESSVVQLGIIDGKRILLTADVGPIGLADAAHIAEAYGIKGQLDVVQIPHHGSRRNVTPSILDHWLGPVVQEGVTRGSAFCSVGNNKNEYPRKRVANAFIRRGYSVIATRGSTKCHRHNSAPRQGWTVADPEPFSHTFAE